MLNSVYLFQSDVFVRQQGDPIVFRAEAGKNSAELPVFLSGNQIFSPLSAPFGSFRFEGSANAGLVKDIVALLEEFCATQGITQCKLVLPPDCYQPEVHVWLIPLLIDLGFQVAFQDLNFHRDLSMPPESGFHKSERWKLNKLIREGFEFRPVPVPDWEKHYPFLLESRLRKGFQLSMTRRELEQVFLRFPDVYQMHAVYSKDQLAALSVSIQVNPAIRYVFYTADDLAFRKRSPIVLLHYGLLKDCIQTKTQLLDLGTSSLKGVVNNGVATFKRNLGASASLKTTLIRKFRS